MKPANSRRDEVLQSLEDQGGLRPGISESIHRETGVPAAQVYGAATFYHLLKNPDVRHWVCEGLSCKLAGSDALMSRSLCAEESSAYSPCLGRCDSAPASWKPHALPDFPPASLSPRTTPLALDLGGGDRDSYAALSICAQRGPDWVIGELEASGLTGRGGAGFPAHLKWGMVRAQAEPTRYLVMNADEGEPGTFKDREIMLRRPHLVIESLAIGALTIGAKGILISIRGEYGDARVALERALEVARGEGRLVGLAPTVTWTLVSGHGAYICGEETALLEALEGKRGMPRMKPPFPTEVGLFGKPTLIQNVETMACIPAILERGGSWFRGLGRTEPGTKLYCLSGHVERPGVYEAPLGITLRELLELGGGVKGTLQAFSPGGASSGFLPADKIDVPLDFSHLKAVGSMLGSAGVVVLNDTVDMSEAALIQARFFESESCGQCAPCRIGTQVLSQAIQRFRNPGVGGNAQPGAACFSHVDDVAWGMAEASICGLGQAASLPLTSAMKYFPEQFEANRTRNDTGEDPS